MTLVVKLQRYVKSYLSKLRNKRKQNGYHRPNQSSIRFKANRLSISNPTIDASKTNKQIKPSTDIGKDELMSKFNLIFSRRNLRFKPQNR